MPNKHGDWIWYELLTSDADAATGFYEKVVGWSIAAPKQDGFDYREITASEGMIGGMLPLTAEMTAGGARPGWLGYVAVDDVDKMVASIEEGGGNTLMPATDMDGIGRFALVADPQGTPFYVMRPIPPANAPDATSYAFSYERPRDGHCAWNELSTSDPHAALHFYGGRLGWVKDGEMDMGPMGKYEFIRHGEVIGAVMPKPPPMPVSAWTFYFRVPDIDAAGAAITELGGTIMNGPHQVPGGDWTIQGMDPQGGFFALVGKKKG